MANPPASKALDLLLREELKWNTEIHSIGQTVVCTNRGFPPIAGGLTRDSSASVMAFTNAYTYLVLSGLIRTRASTT